jgi:hypothetical protein
VLVAGQRDPKVLAELAQGRLKVKKAQLAEGLTGRFRDVHAVEVGLLIDLIDNLEAKTAALTEKIAAQLASLPGVPAACTGCGVLGEHTPDCADRGPQLPSLVARLDEIPGIGPHTAHVLIAELGLDMSQFPSPGTRLGLGQARPSDHPVRGRHTAGQDRQGQPMAGRRRDGGRQDRHLPRRTLPAHPPPSRQAESVPACSPAPATLSQPSQRRGVTSSAIAASTPSTPLSRNSGPMVGMPR